VDFGLSNTHDGGRLLATACGSPCYAAPEMIAGKKYVGPLADVWSMGVILFALVCGYLPFEDPNTAVLYKKILSGDYKPAKWISPEIKDLIRRILEVDPKKRYTMNDIRKHPWYTMVAETSIPKEIVNEKEDEFVRNETLKFLSSGGLDMQSLLDGLASHACNSLTAMYYLFEQKQRTARIKNGLANVNNNNQNGVYHSDSVIPSTSSSQQPLNGSNTGNNNNAETEGRQQQQQHSHRPKSQPAAAVPSANTAGLHSVPHPHQPVNPPVSAHPSHQQQQQQVVKPSPLFQNTSTVPPVNAVKPTPYLQAPLLPQHHSQQHSTQHQSYHQAQHPGMPSLDYYMKTGLTLPIGQQQPQHHSIPPLNLAAIASNNNNNNNPPDGRVKMIITKPAPQVNVNSVNKGNQRSIVPPLSQRPINSLTDHNDPLSSQTARLPGANTLLATSIAPPTGSLSARPVLETPMLAVIPPEFAVDGDIGGEGKGRPNTRRSRMRSRNGEAQIREEEQLFAHEPLPAEGILEMDELPINNNNLFLSANNSNNISVFPISTPPNETEERQSIDHLTADIQRLGVAENSQNEQKVNPLLKAATAVKAPDGAPRPTVSQGGRRGKNLVATSTPAAVPSAKEDQLSAATLVTPQQQHYQQLNGERKLQQQQQQQPLYSNQPMIPLKPAVPVGLPAGVAPDNHAISMTRNEASRNKVNALGSLRIN
jgi:serine/threonine protein kinase